MSSGNCFLLIILSVFVFCHAVTSSLKLEDQTSQAIPTLSNLDLLLPPPNCTNVETTHQNKLECFLWNLKVEIPEQSFEKGWITISVHDMLCTNFRLHGLRSNFTEASLAGRQQEPSISTVTTSVQTVSATCQGRYHVTGGVAGNIRATVSTSSQALELVVGITDQKFEDQDNKHHNGTAINLPSSFETIKCGTRLGCESIKFSGSISAKMIQAFSGSIGRHITGALQQDVCPMMTQFVDPIVTAYFKKFDDLVKPYLEATTEKSTVPNELLTAQRLLENNTETKDIVEFPAIRTILSFLNEQLRYHLQKGWIPLPPPSSQGGTLRHISPECIDSFRGISGWVKSMFGPRPRIRLPKYLRHLVFPIPDEIGANGTIILNIKELMMEGLDQMDVLQILEPSMSEPKDLQTTIITQNGFSVVLPVNLEVRWPSLQTNDSPTEEENDYLPPPTLKESFSLMINITNIDATLSSLIQVTDWDSMSIPQVIDAVQRFVKSRNIDDLRCLIRTLHNVQLSRNGSWLFNNILFDTIRLKRNEKDAPNGSLEADLDHTINTIVDLFLTNYSNLWTHLVRGLVRGPASRNLNRFVKGWIQKHSNSSDDGGGQCPPANVSTKQWVNFTKFDFLNTFNNFLGHSHTKKSLNDFVKCFEEGIEDAVNGDDPVPYNVSDGYKLAHAMDTRSIVTAINPNDPESLFDALNNIINTYVKSGEEFSISGDNSDKKITLSRIEIANWDSVQRLQIIKPTRHNCLASSLLIGESTSSEIIEDRDVSLIVPNESNDCTSSSKGPAILMVINVDGYEISGQVNLTLFGSFDANVELNIDYDLTRLENLTMSHLLEEMSCALLPAMQIRAMPGTTNLTFGKCFGANITATLGGRNISLSTNDYPRFLEVGNDILSWSQEFARTAVNYAADEWIGLSSTMCPGVIFPDEKEHGARDNWSWSDFQIVWIVLGFLAIMQGGLVLVSRYQSQGSNSQDSNQPNNSDGVENTLATPLLSSYQELNSRSFKEMERNQGMRQDNSRNEFNIRGIGDEWNNDDGPQGILEDQLVRDCQEEAKISIFDSDNISEYIKYLVPVMIVGTIILFLCSNLSVGATVDLFVQLDQRSIGVPGIFQFSLAKTISEMYQAGIYPLLILVVCFSGIWPYVKLLSMFYFWMIPCDNKHQQERRLLLLDACGKYSLVDNYVLILFVVAFRFHLGISDNLGIDVYVTPVFGFFSFLFATCLSLMLGHAVLFFHRTTMQHHCGENSILIKTSLLNHGFKMPNQSSFKRLSRFAQGILLLSLISTTGILIFGFLQESFTFEIGGLAGIFLGEDVSKTSYSVLSLGNALPSSVENPQSPSIVFLQGTFFFFTMVTPILCLVLILILMITPLTIKWQRYLLVAAEITNSWSAVEVFLLSILAALFQISTFASFMIGDKCDEINILAQKIFYGDNDTVCFSVDASVESDCWYLLCGACANFVLVSFCLETAEAAVKEKEKNSDSDGEPSSDSEFSLTTTRPDQSFIHKLHGIPVVSCIMFALVSSSHVTEEEEEVSLMEDQREPVQSPEKKYLIMLQR